jgi:hypothetical protein
MTDPIEQSIQELNRREPRRSLEGLEADIWAGVAASARETSLSKAALGVQAVILLAAMVGSLAIGNWAATSGRTKSELTVFSESLELAPSTLLMGEGA